MLVKICGITNREDALAAVDAGAGALGFIFCAGSPRATTPEALEPWIAELPGHVLRVGVYVNEASAVIEANAARLGLHVTQLHGDETPADHPRHGTVWRALRVGEQGITQPDYAAHTILLDGPGGGRTFNWALAAELAARRRVILAGGLTPENVRQAIEQVRPWGVDTA
ncbi:MAG TPA: phosphoribosylanthranilate isomerase, partial [Bryobacteraceae bacterium]|nr:phosphoribosylanthranilate isomerase [Bryobacteraceae bacterium]